MSKAFVNNHSSIGSEMLFHKKLPVINDFTQHVEYEVDKVDNFIGLSTDSNEINFNPMLGTIDEKSLSPLIHVYDEEDKLYQNTGKSFEGDIIFEQSREFLVTISDKTVYKKNTSDQVLKTSNSILGYTESERNNFVDEFSFIINDNSYYSKASKLSELNSKSDVVGQYKNVSNINPELTPFFFKISDSGIYNKTTKYINDISKISKTVSNPNEPIEFYNPSIFLINDKKAYSKNTSPNIISKIEKTFNDSQSNITPVSHFGNTGKSFFINDKRAYDKKTSPNIISKIEKTLKSVDEYSLLTSDYRLENNSYYADRLNVCSNKNWVVGTNGNVTDEFGQLFSACGTTAAENVRELGVGPFGVQEVLWRAKANDAASDPDGGWDKTHNVDCTKDYVSLVFIRMDVASGGRFYHGCMAGSVDLLNYGAPDLNNPYFGNPLWTEIGATSGQWFVSIGFINGVNNNAPNTQGGIYKLDGSRTKVSQYSNFKFRAGVTTNLQRVYNYYDTVTTSQVTFASPLVAQWDSTLSIDSILSLDFNAIFKKYVEKIDLVKSDGSKIEDIDVRNFMKYKNLVDKPQSKILDNKFNSLAMYIPYAKDTELSFSKAKSFSLSPYKYNEILPAFSFNISDKKDSILINSKSDGYSVDKYKYTEVLNPDSFYIISAKDKNLNLNFDSKNYFVNSSYKVPDKSFVPFISNIENKNNYFFNKKTSSSDIFVKPLDKTFSPLTVIVKSKEPDLFLRTQVPFVNSKTYAPDKTVFPSISVDIVDNRLSELNVISTKSVSYTKNSVVDVLPSFSFNVGETLENIILTEVPEFKFTVNDKEVAPKKTEIYKSLRTNIKSNVPEPIGFDFNPSEEYIESMYFEIQRGIYHKINLSFKSGIKIKSVDGLPEGISFENDYIFGSTIKDGLYACTITLVNNTTVDLVLKIPRLKRVQ